MSEPICEALTAIGQRCTSRASRMAGDRHVCCRTGHDQGPFVEHVEVTIWREKFEAAQRNVAEATKQRDNYARVMMEMCAKFLDEMAAAREARASAVSMAEQVIRESDWLSRRTVQDRKRGPGSLDRDLATIAFALGQDPWVDPYHRYVSRIGDMAAEIRRGRWKPERPTSVRVQIDSDAAWHRVDGFVEHLLEMVLGCPCEVEETE